MTTESHLVLKEKPEMPESEDDSKQKTIDDLEMNEDEDDDEPEIEEVTTKTWKQVNTNKQIQDCSKEKITDKE